MNLLAVSTSDWSDEIEGEVPTGFKDFSATLG
ncbi:MAG: hypothetical protein CEN91_170 [Candidatus Berkelbacteria bacterium Licking1014_85]|uniref:Uncharacterized protein n=1 Tax=Candidatus Berkelbacteria bacterium Licking1014_85 TaxID=2017148 RepID=A0A554LL87_9BACT|nr:MAG: hypothetical protein CEN91_170 [Candidatus Berkelbacteria bacterium Licking1014_85]